MATISPTEKREAGENTTLVESARVTEWATRRDGCRWRSLSEGGGRLSTDRAVDCHEASCWRFAEWLRYGFQIRNNNGTICWWGELHGVEITVGALTVGLSLDEMSNRIMVRFALFTLSTI